MSVGKRPGRRAYILVGLFALALVLFPFLFWYNTWFGRKLSDAEMDRYFVDFDKPRHVQHALVQLGERMSRGQDGKRWYERVIYSAKNPNLEIRQTAAWIMGQDKSWQPFHEALLKLLNDSQPMVRRNAALSLAAFGDGAARPELAAMLRPYTVTASNAGVLHYRLKADDYVNPGTLLAHIGDAEVRSPVPGAVRSLDASEGAMVKPGDALVTLGADANHVWEALRGMYVVGGVTDLDDVERYTRPVPGMPEKIARQALETKQAISDRMTGAVEHVGGPPAPR